MEENQSETQHPPGKHGSLPLLFLSIFVAVYLLFPPIFIYPVALVYRNSPTPEYIVNATVIFYHPVGMLAHASPAYEKLLSWEFGVIGLNYD